MAVLLCRSDGKPFPAMPPLELRNSPRVVVKNEPICTEETTGNRKKVSARSETHYACAEPAREEFWRGTYDRRRIQLTQCGFHGPSHRPYRDMGPVVLDDRKLILEGLGQTMTPTHEQCDEQSPHQRTDKPQVLKQQQSTNLVSPYRVQLRAKTSSQFPNELSSLEQKIDQGDKRLEFLRKGRGLFVLMREAEREKQLVEEQQALMELETHRIDWNEAEIASDIDLLEDGTIHWQTEPSANSLRYGRKRSCVVASDIQAVNDRLGSSCGCNDRSEVGAADEYQCKTIDIVDQWYKTLCVLVWVLEAMRLKSPLFMTPFLKCWRLDHPPVDELRGQRIYEANQKKLQKWEALKKTGDAKKRMRTKAQAIIATKRMSKFMLDASSSNQSTPTRENSTLQDGSELSPGRHSQSGKSPVATPPHAWREKRQDGSTTIGATTTTTTTAGPGAASVNTNFHGPSKEEEEKIRKQKKLTPSQMESLQTLLDEELNWSQKQSRSRINALLREADQARLQNDSNHEDKERALQLPPILLDVGAVEKQFAESEEGRQMIVHEQLTAMERDRAKAIQQRFNSLRVSGNLWQDLAVMREGVQIETTSMARRRLLMNYEWYQELNSSLPEEVKSDRYCKPLLESLFELSQHMYNMGPKKMSKKRLIQVLATLKPWELKTPEIEAAVQFLIQHLIYIVSEDYTKWLEQHTLAWSSKGLATGQGPAAPKIKKQMHETPAVPTGASSTAVRT